MAFDDAQLEALLKTLPLVKPSAAMDARVLGVGKGKVWPLVAIGLSMAAAAVVLLTIALHLPVLQDSSQMANNMVLADASFRSASMPNLAMPDNYAQVHVEQVVQVISDELQPADNNNQPPLREIHRRNFQKIVWVDKTSGIRIETMGQPQEEVILEQAQVN